MKKAEMVQEVAKVVGSMKDARKAVDCVFSTITETLKSGDEVRIAGFGTFRITRRKAREGVNPRTGERLKIKERTIPRFVPSKGFRDVLD